MSKKSKRMRAKYQAGSASNIDSNERKTVVNTAIKPSGSIVQRGSLANQDTQYKYIIPELVRIFIIAGIFFLIIIVLSFVLK